MSLLLYTHDFDSISADSWPQVFDDSEARLDWLWKPKYDLDKLVDCMVQEVRENYVNCGDNQSQ